MHAIHPLSTSEFLRWEIPYRPSVYVNSAVSDSCDPMDCSLPGSSVRGIFLTRILEWVVISYFRGSSWPRDQTHISCVSCIGRWILYHWAIREVLWPSPCLLMSYLPEHLEPSYSRGLPFPTGADEWMKREQAQCCLMCKPKDFEFVELTGKFETRWILFF